MVWLRWQYNRNADGRYTFECQHGPRECLGNRMQACALNEFGADEAKSVEYIKCFMSVDNFYPYNTTTVSTCLPVYLPTYLLTSTYLLVRTYEANNITTSWTVAPYLRYILISLTVKGDVCSLRVRLRPVRLEIVTKISPMYFGHFKVVEAKFVAQFFSLYSKNDDQEYRWKLISWTAAPRSQHFV